MTALAGAGAALEQVVDDLPVALQRVDRHDVAQARTLLTRTGAVVLTGWPVVEGYQLVDRLREARPELHAFVTTVDVDVTSGIESPSSRPPQVCRLVEWTRGGRRVVRTPQSAVPVPRDPDADRHRQLLEAYRDVVAAAAAPQGRDTALRAGEVLVLDNDRWLHGVLAHEGPRTMLVGPSRSADAL